MLYAIIMIVMGLGRPQPFYVPPKPTYEQTHPACAVDAKVCYGVAPRTRDPGGPGPRR